MNEPGPEQRPLTPDELASLARALQLMLAEIQPQLRPSLVAELQERVWQQTELLHTLNVPDGPRVPLVTRPRNLPMPLNPFFFTTRP